MFVLQKVSDGGIALLGNYDRARSGPVDFFSGYGMGNDELQVADNLVKELLSRKVNGLPESEVKLVEGHFDVANRDRAGLAVGCFVDRFSWRFTVKALHKFLEGLEFFVVCHGVKLC